MTTFASLFGGGRLADIGALQAGCELIWDVELDAAIATIVAPPIVFLQNFSATSIFR